MSHLSPQRRQSFEGFVYDERVTISVQRSGNEALLLLRGREVKVDVVEVSEDTLSLLIDGRSYDVVIDGSDGAFHVLVDGVAFDIRLLDPRNLRTSSVGLLDKEDPVSVVAPMPGRVVRVLFHEGEFVREGQGVAVIEAMKMQNELKTPKSGKVAKVNVTENQTVNAGECLVVIQ